ncbi:hypothetical protein [Pseudanabaena sp. Chao 1811]|uniref:hypothetical protein n=1 Tax=Pseudanabaena sp. Chao 1811 TaxID=2963092 RepID=UPI0022F3CAEA|nr:hypothetical protein [Pseudanabaena sp. Chao 1811]
MYKYNHKHIDLLEPQKHQDYFRKVKFLLLSFLIIYSVYMLNKPPESSSLAKVISVLGIIWVGTIPCFQYLGYRNRPSIPFLPLVGYFYDTTFSFPMFFDDKKIHCIWSLTDNDLTKEDNFY